MKREILIPKNMLLTFMCQPEFKQLLSEMIGCHVHEILRVHESESCFEMTLRAQQEQGTDKLLAILHFSTDISEEEFLENLDSFDLLKCVIHKSSNDLH